MRVGEYGLGYSNAFTAKRRKTGVHGNIFGTLAKSKEMRSGGKLIGKSLFIIQGQYFRAVI